MNRQADKRIPVGVLGATGAVGQRMVSLLADHPWFELVELAASARSAARTYGEAVKWKLASPLPAGAARLRVRSLDPAEGAFASRILFSALDSDVAGEAEARLAAAGHAIVSNSKNHRMVHDVPLVIPEVNGEHLALVHAQRKRLGSNGFIVTNPNCSSTGMTMALAPILERFGIQSVVVATLQAVSGAGYPGLPSMDILDNVIPFISGEEEKIELEPRKMLGRLAAGNDRVEEAPIAIDAMVHRVPVVDGHLGEPVRPDRAPGASRGGAGGLGGLVEAPRARPADRAGRAAGLPGRPRPPADAARPRPGARDDDLARAPARRERRGAAVRLPLAQHPARGGRGVGPERGAAGARRVREVRGAPVRPLVVHKFGGTSVGSAERIAAAAEILAAAARRQRVVAVVSATAGTTNALLAAAREAREGKTARWQEGLAAIREKHLALARLFAEREAGLSRARKAGARPVTDPVVAVEGLIAELQMALSGISLLRELSDRTLDVVASFGERLSAPIAAAALRAKGIEAEPVDARSIVLTDERHGRATADLKATGRAARRTLGRLLDRGVMPIVTGFIATGRHGETTTLGRSGSDTTAAILGAALGAERIVIWTDVDGIHSADPRFVPGTRVLPRLTYREAAELTYFGAKVLHFPAMIPAIAAQVPIVIKNSFRPAAPGTIIDARGSGRSSGIAAVTAIRNLATVSLEGKGMVGVPGIAARAFSAVAREKISVLMFSQASSEQNICLVVPEEDRARSLRALREEFAAEIALGKLDGVKAHGPVAAVAAVGEGMRGTPGIAARLFSAVAAAKVNLEAIAQGSSEVNISFVVEDRDAAAAVAAIHRLCIAGRVRR